MWNGCSDNREIRSMSGQGRTMSRATLDDSRPRSGERLAAACGAALYALVGLGLRFVIARVFFMAGQAKIAGPVVVIPLWFRDASLPVTLPAAVKPATFELFANQYAALPMSPTFAAYLFSYAEFVLPICLVLGFATRLSALALLAMTVLVQICVMPEPFWATPVYLTAILAVLVAVGPGGISLDALIRAIARH